MVNCTLGAAAHLLITKDSVDTVILMPMILLKKFNTFLSHTSESFKLLAVVSTH